MDEFVLVDLISDLSALPAVRLEALGGVGEHFVVLASEVYRRDLSAALPNTLAARKQLALDAPRCDLWHDGLRDASGGAVPSELVPFCTQAVMGLPLTLAGAAGMCVGERDAGDRRMLVDASGAYGVRARKPLRAWAAGAWATDGRARDVVVTVHVAPGQRSAASIRWEVAGDRGVSDLDVGDDH